MQNSHGLERHPVFQNLRYSWSFYGLHLTHFLLAGGLTMGVFLLALLAGFNILYGFAFFAAVCVGLIVIQYRKPPDYVGQLYDQITLPRHFCCFVPDTDTCSFPVPPELVLGATEED